MASARGLGAAAVDGHEQSFGERPGLASPARLG